MVTPQNSSKIFSSSTSGTTRSSDFIPLLRLLAEEPDSATGFFERYRKGIRRRLYRSPPFRSAGRLPFLCAAAEAEAKAKYREGILAKLYIAPMLLEDAETPRNPWHPNDRAEPNYAAEFIDSYAVLWDREPGALRLLRETRQELRHILQKFIRCGPACSIFRTSARATLKSSGRSLLSSTKS